MLIKKKPNFFVKTLKYKIYISINKKLNKPNKLEILLEIICN